MITLLLSLQLFTSNFILLNKANAEVNDNSGGWLSGAKKIGVCAGIEVLADGNWIWCPTTEDAFYVLTARAEDGKIENFLRPYIIDWSFYLYKDQDVTLRKRELKILTHVADTAGFVVIDIYKDSIGQDRKVESRYNYRGQLVSAKVVQ